MQAREIVAISGYTNDADRALSGIAEGNPVEFGQTDASLAHSIESSNRVGTV